MDFQKANQSKTISILINSLSALILLFIIASFAQYYSTKLTLKNPLIPEHIVDYATIPILKKAIILLIGLVSVFIIKSFKKNIIALIVAILLVIFYISYSQSLWLQNILR